MWPRKGMRNDLVLSMTLAETFLFLVFIIWYGVVPSIKPVTNPPSATPPEVLIAHLQEENARLKAQLEKQQAELDDIKLRLVWWHKNFPDLDIPKSPDELERLRSALGRGKPACDPNDNVLAGITVLDGQTSLKILHKAAKDFKGVQNLIPGAILTSKGDLEAFLNSTSKSQRIIGNEAHECRWDYTLTYATYQDYFEGRERFEKYFYCVHRNRALSLFAR